MFEHHRKELLSKQAFIKRQITYVWLSRLILAASIGFGTAGYHLFGNLSLVDSFLNASMILTGMGPVDHRESVSGKIFAAFYALFSGVAFLTFVGVLFAPVYHRLLHRFHLSMDEDNRDDR